MHATHAAVESIPRNSALRMLPKLNSFKCHKHGHISKNCPERSRGSDGKGAGKKSKGVHKGDNWSKGKGKKGKGKGKGKSKGKKAMGRKIS